MSRSNAKVIPLSFEPTYAFLSGLVPASSLLQTDSLKKAVRLWLLLEFFSGNLVSGLPPASFKAWYDWATGSSSLQPFGEQPLTTLSIADCLFELAQLDEVTWLETYQRQSHQDLDSLRTLLSQIYPFVSPSSKPISLASYRRWLRNDFYALEELGALQKIPGGNQFMRSPVLPPQLSGSSHYPSSPSSQDATILTLELSQMLDRYRHPIHNVQRLYLYLDYVVSDSGSDQVLALQTFLYEKVWSQRPVPLLRFEYDSRSLQEHFSVITYPIALYYAQRAPYLCGYGEDPPVARTDSPSITFASIGCINPKPCLGKPLNLAKLRIFLPI